MKYDRGALETAFRTFEDPLVSADRRIAAGETRICRQQALIARAACKGLSTELAEAVLQTMLQTLSLMYAYRDSMLRARRGWCPVPPGGPCESQPTAPLQLWDAGETCRVTFQSTQVHTDCADAEGQLVFADNRLVAVLVRLADEAHSDDMRDKWFLEVGFGPCATQESQVFPAMADAIAWLHDRVLGTSHI